MGWADQQVSNQQEIKYADRNACKVIDPLFVELVDSVFENLKEGLKKLRPHDRPEIDPGIRFFTGWGSAPGYPGVCVGVEPDYGQRLFKVWFSLYGHGIREKVVSVRDYKVSDQFVDSLAHELIKEVLV